MKVVLLKENCGGFAYGPHEQVIKLEVRPAQNGWFFEERSGIKGGTLKDVPSVTVKDEAAAMALLDTRIETELRNGYRRTM